MLELDHIVLGADSLEQGVRYISDKFGVVVPKGGEHLQMGTYNCLMSLGSGCYFEIIAIAPHLEPPEHPRWFDLDNPEQQAKIKARPRILTWVARTLDLDATRAQTFFDLGEVVAMQRGDLTWRLCLRPDGSLPIQGLCPSLIEWPNNRSPAGAMMDFGCEITRLTLQCSDLEGMTEILQDIGAGELVHIEPAVEGLNSITAEFSTPQGEVMLD